MSVDEVQCLITIVQALQASLEGGKQQQGGGGTEGTSEEIELLDLLMNLLSCDPNPVRLHKLVILSTPELFRVLVAYVHRHYSENSPTVVLCVQVLSKIIAMCSFDHSPEDKTTYATISRSCGEILHVSQLLPVLHEAFTASITPTEVRLVVVECMFIFIMRNDFLKRHAVHEQKYIPMLLNSVQAASPVDTPMIRNYVCACLRELCNTDEFTPVLIQNQGFGVFLGVLKEHDRCGTDVTALSAEILDALVRAHPEALAHFPQQTSLIDYGRRILEARTTQTAMKVEGSAEVIEAVCKLFETMTIISAQAEDERYFGACVESNVYRSIAHCLKMPSSRIGHVAARSLRYFIQYCPHHHNVGNKCLTHFPTLSHLLKLCVETTSHPELLFEVSMVLALALSQNPHTRRHVHREVAQSFPLWTQSIQNVITRALSASHEASTLAGVVIVDCTGVLLNNVQAVQWEVDGPLGPNLHADALRTIYAHQQKRISWHNTLQNRYFFHSPYPDLPKAAHLTLHILLQAVQMTLGSERRSPSPKQSQPHYTHPSQPLNTPELASVLGQTPYRATENVTPIVQQQLQYDSPKPFPPAAQVHVQATEDAEQYRKFDLAFSLASRLAKHYTSNIKKKAPVYMSTGDGFVVRKTNFKNPWTNMTPLEKVQAWSAKDLVEGDLFYFNIPFNELSTLAIEAALSKASQHHVNAKKLFMTTPQAAKGRRWFLYDMINFIMPGIISLLQDLLKAIQLHGEENVRFPLFMYREKEMFEGERSIHCGNIQEIVQQVQFYFTQHMK